MKVGPKIRELMNRAEHLLERFDAAPTEVHNVLQERRHRDTFTGNTARLDSWLASDDFKLKYEEAMQGTSFRAGEVKRVEETVQAYHRDAFEAFKPAPVSLKPPMEPLRASQLQRVFIAA